MIPCYQENITQLLVLEVGLHLTESLFCMICGLEKLIGGVGVHSGEGAQSQPAETMKEGKKTHGVSVKMSVSELTRHLCILGLMYICWKLFQKPFVPSMLCNMCLFKNVEGRIKLALYDSFRT